MAEPADLQDARARFERVWPDLLPVLLGLFRHHGLGHQAQDLAQQVALRLLVRFEAIATDEQMKAYALTAARWIMADHWRSLRGAETVPLDVLQDVTAEAATPSEAMEARQAALAVLAQLTPRESEIVVRVMRGESVDEIGRSMRVAPATVRSLLRHARRRIVSALIDYDDRERTSK
jgi:RNA polymerase sigma factor (sigma-70 family)